MDFVKLKIICSNCSGSGYSHVYVNPLLVCKICLKQIEEDPTKYEQLIRFRCKRRITLGLPSHCSQGFCNHNMVTRWGQEFCSERCSRS